MTSSELLPTACVLCECNCGIEVKLGGESGRNLVRINGDKRHPSSRGYACEKAHRLDFYQNDRDRLTSPLRRRPDGTFEPIDWDTAIREVAARLGAVKDEHGGESIFYYGGGGQGNHLPGAYATATRRALSSRYRSSALAQEKTGEFWMADRTFGGGTRADFEHCDVGLFIGKNPWHSHSIPRARVTLKEMSKDPARTLIVIDPRHTETAALADIHLAVRPGQDAALLSAILGVIVQEDLIDSAFLEQHAIGTSEVLAVFGTVDVPALSVRAGIAEALVRKAAHAIGTAEAMASFEDLGVQMNHDSTVVSYLHRLLIGLTGSLGKPGTHYFPTTIVSLMGGASKRRSPVADALIVAGLVPCNLIADEILTDHPKRYRAMIVEAVNPAHSLADSQRMREALGALDTLVVIDVAMSETAQLADYVLPAATQFEKAEATFFNFEFPENYFHLRPRLFAPPEGPLPEAEIHSRLVMALGAVTDEDLAPFAAALETSREAFIESLVSTAMGDPRLTAQLPIILYRTLGPTLPDELREGAVLLGLALRAVMEKAPSLARAGFVGTPMEAAGSVFDAMLESSSGFVFAVDEWSEVMKRIGTKSRKLELELPDMLDELKKVLAGDRDAANDEFPYVLSAGERRSFTANTIIRDPSWRKKDAEGALRISPADADALGVATGGAVRVTTKRGSVVAVAEVSDTMQPGHVSLPNGLGLSNAARGDTTAGIAPNELTSSEDRDPFVGTPWHKHVRARLERA